MSITTPFTSTLTRRAGSVAALALTASLVLAVSSCGGSDNNTGDTTEQNSTSVATQPGTSIPNDLADSEWRHNNFQQSPFYLPQTKVNAQAWAPTSPGGVPLPDDVAEGTVFWELPACVIVPFTSDGPTTGQLVDGKYLHLTGYKHTELGAAAAAFGLIQAAADAKDQNAAAAAATGLNAKDAEHLVATNDLFNNSAGGFRATTANCGSQNFRPLGYRVVGMTKDSARVDIATPGERSDEALVVTVVLRWEDGDWRLDPQTFDLWDRKLSEVKKGNYQAEKLSEFTLW